jgi:glycosyltransferase involved in cell wall biosynthesis
MKILQICNKIPYPTKDGGTLAMHQLSESLSRLGHEVRILAMDTHKQNFSESEWDEEYRKRFQPRKVYMDTRVKVLDAMINLFSDKSYNIERFYSPEFEQVLSEILSGEKFDIIQMESIYVAPYLPVIRKHSSAKVVLRAHNIEHLIWKRLADGERKTVKRKYLQLLSERLKTYEESIIPSFDAIAAITPGDAAYFRNLGCMKPVMHIPFGIEMKPFRPAPVISHSLFFIGAMDWMPNQETVRWILDNLWIKLHVLHPGLVLHIAGRQMPRWLLELDKPNVVVLSNVPDAEVFMMDKAILLAPFFSGGGMRVKFIEAMALKKTVITTAIGAEGIDGRDGEHFLLAETLPGMIAIIARCLADPGFTAYIGANARSLVADKYDSKRIAEKLEGLYKSLV